MTKHELSNINTNVRKMILEHIKQQNISLNAFAKGAGVHQNQLWLYLYSGSESKGLHSATLEKIGKYLSQF